MSNSTQQESSSVVGNLIDEYYPKGVPLSAIYKKGFAYKTIGYRLPVILTQIIDHLSRDKNEIGERLGQEARDDIKDIVGRLAKVKNEMQTNKPIPSIGCPIWDKYLEDLASNRFGGNKNDVRWYMAPWLFVECYLYQRIKLAFLGSRHLQTYDYFQKLKETGFTESLDPSAVLGEFVLDVEANKTNLQVLMEVSLWGNRCDLSISTGQSNSQTIHLLDHLNTLRTSILCDESTQFWETLNKLKEANSNIENSRVLSIGYVLDNAGFELFTDLCFADILLSQVDRIDFYVKVMPWFVSDALQHDFDWLLDEMGKVDQPVLNKLSQKWKGHIKSNRWRVVAEPFWTYPHGFHEMEKSDNTLYSTLSSHSLLIFKGDLNYRKLVGDMNWERDMPFKDSLRGFLPAPLLALRTLKADTVTGLRTGLPEEMDNKDPDWMVTGEYGLIQFAR